MRFGAVRKRAGIALGAVGAAIVVFALGELYLRIAPPSDLTPYLRESEKTGPYRADSTFGVQYKSLESLAADNPGRLEPYLPLFNNPNPPRTWAFFGSSFAQAPGMLADTSRKYVPQRVTFNLGKNEPFAHRFTQAAFLLDSGLIPERIFFICIPLDIHSLALHGIDQYRATESGTLVYEPRVPPIGGWLVRNSRLALKGWTRTTLHLNRPWFPASALYNRVDPVVRQNQQEVLARFANAIAPHRVPVTVVLLPSYDQVTRGAKFAVQDALAEDARAVGFDVCDTRAAFLAYPNKPALFIPDKHFSDIGNRVLLATIIDHLKTNNLQAADLPDSAEVRP
jgi:hypothetical protein